VAVLVLTYSVLPALTASVYAHTPADKVVASASTLKKTDSETQPVELLSAQFKTSTTADLMISVSMETALVGKRTLIVEPTHMADDAEI